MAVLYAGLDVSDQTTTICVVDGSGAIVTETVVATSAAAIGRALKAHRRKLDKVGLESGTHASRLYKRLCTSGFPVVCLDARHTHTALSARLNKTDANDAQGLARLLARGIYTSSFVKSDEAIRIKMMLVLRRTLIRKAADLRISLSMTLKQVDVDERLKLREYGLTSRGTDADLILQEAVQGIQRSTEAVTLEIVALQKAVEKFAKRDPICQRLMTVPGVGPVCALTFRFSIDDPHRFASSRVVAAYFGLTPRVRQSGSTSYSGAITRAGDAEVRGALYSAAHTLLSVSRSESKLRKWGLAIAKRKGRKIAYIAVARKLAVLLHHLWVTGEVFDSAR